MDKEQQKADINELVITQAGDNKGFLEQIKQTLFIVQEIHNSFTLLIGKYELGITQGVRLQEQIEKTLLECQDLKEDMTKDKEAIKEILVSAQEELERFRNYVLEQKNAILKTLEEFRETKEFVKKTKEEILSYQDNIKHLLNQLEELESLINELSLLIETNKNLKVEILEEITNKQEELKVGLDEHFEGFVQIFENFREEIAQEKQDLEARFDRFKEEVEIDKFAEKEELEKIKQLIPNKELQESQEKKDLQTQIEAKQQELQEKQTHLQELHESLNALPNPQTLEELSAQKQEKQTQLESLQSQITALEEEIANKTSEIESKKEQITAKEQELENASEEDRPALQEELARLQEELAKLESLKIQKSEELEQSRRDKEDLVTLLLELGIQENELKLELRKTQEQRENLKEQIQNSLESSESLKQELNNLESQLLDIENAEYEKSLTPSSPSELTTKHYVDKRDEHLKQEFNQKITAIEMLISIDESLEETQEQISNLQGGIKQKEQELQEILEKINYVQNPSTLESQITALEEEIANKTSEIESKKEQITAKEQELENASEEDRPALQEELARLQEELAKLESLKIQKSEELEQKQALKASLPQDSTELEAKKELLSAELEEIKRELEQNLKAKEEALKPTSPSDLTTKSYVDSAINTKDAQNVKLSGNQTIAGNKTLSGVTTLNTTKINGASTLEGVATFSTLPICAIAPTANNHLANKQYVDFGGGLKNLGNQTAPKIDLRESQHFYLTMTAKGAVGIANWGGAGKSGTITIVNAQNITAFSAPFKFRIAQSNFTGVETFAYFCIASNNIRIVRT